MKVYIVKCNDPCECETACNCAGYSIENVYINKKEAEARAKELYHAYVDDYIVVDEENPRMLHAIR